MNITHSLPLALGTYIVVMVLAVIYGLAANDLSLIKSATLGIVVCSVVLAAYLLLAKFMSTKAIKGN